MNSVSIANPFSELKPSFSKEKVLYTIHLYNPLFRADGYQAIIDIKNYSTQC